MNNESSDRRTAARAETSAPSVQGSFASVARPFHNALRTTSLLAFAALATLVADRGASAADAPPMGPAVTVTASRPAVDTPLEVAYATQLRRQLDRAKRCPTGREASLAQPSGSASVWVDVWRDGKVVDRGLVRTSGSGLLDSMAGSLVARTRYPAFPDTAWTERPTHRFLVTYDFVRDRDRAIEPVSGRVVRSTMMQAGHHPAPSMTPVRSS